MHGQQLMEQAGTVLMCTTCRRCHLTVSQVEPCCCQAPNCFRLNQSMVFEGVRPSLPVALWQPGWQAITCTTTRLIQLKSHLIAEPKV
jgi:hypothetical protein